MTIDIEKNLETLWAEDKYIKFFKTNSELNEIFNRRYVYSLVEPCDILIVGINPSYVKGGEHHEKFKFKDCEGRYFGKFHRIMNKIDTLGQYKVDYLDLLNIRVTEQKQLYKFLGTKEGIEFISEQLLLSQRIIEEIKPKLIVVFNRLAGNLLGANMKFKDGKLTNVWLGYEYYKPENYNCHLISGLINSTERIGSLQSTQLIGTPVYFSKYLGRAKNIDVDNIINHIREIISTHVFLSDKYIGRDDFINNVNSFYEINRLKLKAVKNQKYEESARLRDLEKEILKLLHQ